MSSDVKAASDTLMPTGAFRLLSPGWAFFMEVKPMTQKQLKALLHYDPETGVFTWKENRGLRLLKGVRAGWITDKGHRRIRVMGKSYRGGRLAFFYMTGRFPVCQVDHENRIPDDDTWSNLREATYTQNSQNQGLSRVNTSGVRGVSWFKPTSKWVACIGVGGKKKTLGYFGSIAEAEVCRANAEQRYFGEFSPRPVVNRNRGI